GSIPPTWLPPLNDEAAIFPRRRDGPTGDREGARRGPGPVRSSRPFPKDGHALAVFLLGDLAPGVALPQRLLGGAAVRVIPPAPPEHHHQGDDHREPEQREQQEPWPSPTVSPCVCEP